MKLIFMYPGLLTNKISVIGLPLTPQNFMRDHFPVPKSQYGARYLQLELSVLTSLKMREKGLLTVTEKHYVHMLENFLGPELARHPVNKETFFQQDGATSHTARDSMAAMRNLFPNHVISRYGDITWPARSPDLSACDFFLWGYLKSQVLEAPAPHTVQELKHRIQQEVKGIPVKMFQRVMGDVRKRLAECLERNGGHLNDIFRK
jgi:hypothetical protein